MKAAPFSSSAKVAYADLPRDYTGLCQGLLPRPIRNRRQAERVERLIDILAVHQRRLSADQKDYLAILTDILETWDESQAPTPGAVTEPGDFLKLLLEASGQTSAAVGRAVGLDRSVMSRLLKGERAFTVSQARALAEHFAVDAGVFLGLSPTHASSPPCKV